MRLLLILLLEIALLAQDPPEDLHISARPLSPSDINALFGSLNKRYNLEQIDICSRSSQSLTVPLGLIRQQFSSRNTVILSGIVANSVIAHAQSSTKKALAFRLGITAVEMAAVGTTLSSIGTAWKAGLTEGAIGGAQIISILQNTSTSASLISYGANSLPELIQFQPFGCAPPAVQLVEGVAGSLDFGVVVVK